MKDDKEMIVPLSAVNMEAFMQRGETARRPIVEWEDHEKWSEARTVFGLLLTVMQKPSGKCVWQLGTEYDALFTGYTVNISSAKQHAERKLHAYIQESLATLYGKEEQT